MEPTTNLPTPESHDEIDLREVWNAIWRRRYWPLGGLLIGFAIGAILVVTKSDTNQYSVSVAFDLTQLPERKLPLRAIEDIPENLKEQYQIQLPGLSENPYIYTEAQVMARISNLLQEFIPKNQLDDWTIGATTVKVADGKGKTISRTVENSVTLQNNSLNSENKALRASALLGPFIKAIEEVVYQANRNPTEEDLTKRENFVSAITTVREEATKTSLNRSLALGGLAGLVVGTGLGLFADRRTGKEYSRDQLKRLLPYITALELPALPWDDSTAQQAFASLDAVLDPAKSWLLTSIGSSHPAVSLLQQAVEMRQAELTITTHPPLLSHPLPRYQDWLNQGLLIVIEPGFNTRPALRQVQQLLGQLPQTIDCRLIIVGTPIPSDCAPTS